MVHITHSTYICRIETSVTWGAVCACIPSRDSLCDLSHLSSIILCFDYSSQSVSKKKELSSYLRMDTQVVWTTLSPSPYVEDRQYDTFFCRYAAPTSTYHLPVASSSLSSSENPPSPSLLLFHHTPSSNTEDSPLI